MKFLTIFVLLITLATLISGCSSDESTAEEVKNEEEAENAVEDVSINLDKLSDDLDSISEDLN